MQIADATKVPEQKTLSTQTTAVAFSRPKIFRFLDYKTYLMKRMDDAAKGARGVRQRFAEAIQVSPAFITKLLSDDTKTHLSLEQAERSNRFLSHGEDEADYFIYLVSMARAGTEDLRMVFKRKIEQIRNNNLEMSHPTEVTDVSEEMTAALLSSDWRLGAIFVLVAIPSFQDPKILGPRLDCSQEELASLIERMESVGLLKRENGTLKRARDTLLLRAPFGRVDGRQWRMVSINRSFKQRPNDLFKGCMLELSEKEYLKLQEMSLKLLNEALRLATQPSMKEKAVRINLDLFERVGPFSSRLCRRVRGLNLLGRTLSRRSLKVLGHSFELFLRD